MHVADASRCSKHGHALDLQHDAGAISECMGTGNWFGNEISAKTQQWTQTYEKHPG
jgi:hypothetical protein